MEPENIDALIDRAEAYITNEEYDKGGFLCVFELVHLCSYITGACRHVRNYKSGKLSRVPASKSITEESLTPLPPPQKKN